MKVVIPNQPFLDGGQRFEEGVEYNVEDDRAAYFAENGWLVGFESLVSADSTLDIQSSTLGHEGGF